MTKPLVSFVIRTKNEGRYLERVLKKVFAQTYKKIEVLVIDSGSTDKTLHIVSQFPVKLLHIKPEDFNYSYALNLGIAKVKGDLICIISGHSIPMTNTWLASGVKEFSDNKVAAITGNPSNMPLGNHLPFTFFVTKLFSRRKEFAKGLTNTNSIIRKDLWKIYPFDESLKRGCEDADWALEMLARGYNIIRIPEFAVHHSHFLLGKPGYIQNIWWWRKVNKTLETKKRPSKSFSRLGS